MDIFFRCAGIILIVCVLSQIISKEQKDIGLLLSLFVCSGALVAALSFFQPVIAFLQQLQAAAQLDHEMLEILLKVVGIGLLTQITMLVCSDSGNGAMGKAVQLLSSAVILWLSLPMMKSLLELIRTILGEI